MSGGETRVHECTCVIFGAGQAITGRRWRVATAIEICPAKCYKDIEVSRGI